MEGAVLILKTQKSYLRTQPASFLVIGAILAVLLVETSFSLMVTDKDT